MNIPVLIGIVALIDALMGVTVLTIARRRAAWPSRDAVVEEIRSSPSESGIATSALVRVQDGSGTGRTITVPVPEGTVEGERVPVLLSPGDGGRLEDVGTIPRLRRLGTIMLLGGASLAVIAVVLQLSGVLE